MTAELKNVEKLLVFGYIRIMQDKLTSDSEIYPIPSEIIHLCYSYYFICKRSLKCILLGGYGAGKTTIITRFMDNTKENCNQSTIYECIHTTSLNVAEYKIEFEIWDVSHKARAVYPGTLGKMYYRGAAIAIVAFDMTRKETFEIAKQWIDQLEEHKTIENVTIGIAANKCDLRHQYDIDMEKVKKYCEEKNAILMETSAKDNVNITKLFEQTGMVLL